MTESIEYALSKDVHNNPIVREIDRSRHRELWKIVSLAAFLVIIMLFAARQHFELLRHGYGVEQMQRERAELEDIENHLKLEIETLRSPARIEALAIELLGLVPPAQADAIVIERVVPAEPPDRSVIARK